MPNAKTADPTPKSFLLWGEGGTGKTTQFLTLPRAEGKTPFAYLFDPAALEAIRGFDIEFEEFIGDEINLNPASSSGSGVGKERTRVIIPPKEPTRYVEWLHHFEKGLKGGFFDDKDPILFDSLTTFGQIVMNRMVWMNNRPGNIAQQDDYMPQMGTVHGAIQKLVGRMKLMGKTILVTAHETTTENKALGYTQITLLLTGKLRDQMHLMFSDVFRTGAEKGKFYIHTKKGVKYPAIRSSYRQLATTADDKRDVTIGDWSHPEKYGLGRLMSQGTLPVPGQ